MDPSAIDPIVYTGAGGPVPNGAFLFEGGAVDTNDSMWSKQKQAEERVLETYAKREERSLLDSFRRQQEQLENSKIFIPSPIPLITAHKPSKPAKKLIPSIISIRPAKHAGGDVTPSPTSTTSDGTPAKRPRCVGDVGVSETQGESVGHQQDREKRDQPSDRSRDVVTDAGKEAGAAEAAGNNAIAEVKNTVAKSEKTAVAGSISDDDGGGGALATLATYSESDEES